MNKVGTYFLALIMMCALVFAAGEQPEKSGNPEMIANNENVKAPDGSGNEAMGEEINKINTQNMGEEKQIMVQTREESGSEKGLANSEEARTRVQEKIQAKEKELEDEMKGKTEKEQKVLQNQNQVRIAVHALLEMKDGIGGIGPQISEIAKHFENSVQKTIEAEEKLQTRSSFSRFFAGGDKLAAEKLELEVKANKEKVEQLKQLKEECECDEEAKALMQEQIQSMEQEQERLGEIAAKEKKSKGIFGWLWK
jgi:hypothetical protein